MSYYLFFVVFICGLLPAVVTLAPISDKVTALLKRTISEKGVADILVTFNVPSPDTLEKIAGKVRKIGSRGEKLKTIVDALEAQATSSQAKARAILEQASLAYSILWITNQLLIKSARAEIIDAITALHGVSEVTEDEIIEFIKPLEKYKDDNQQLSPKRSRKQKQDLTYGLETMKVPEVWAQGYSGQNVVVGIIDTGVDITHDALRDSYVGSEGYGWFEPGPQGKIPYDDRHHGTHVMGTMAGHNGIGVAPGARWMACKLDLKAAISTAVACLQHFLCPGDHLGNNRNCSKAPRVINNSWGLFTPVAKVYEAVMAFLYADTFLVFAVGNFGPKCETVTYPAGYVDVLAVGATDELDRMAVFSSSGFGKNESVEPQVVAPGDNVMSSLSKNSYEIERGTSMATPHVSGVVALMLSKNPNLRNDEIWDILIKSTEHVSPSRNSSEECNSIPLDHYPNNRAGYGKLNAWKAVNNVKLENH